MLIFAFPYASPFKYLEEIRCLYEFHHFLLSLSLDLLFKDGTFEQVI